MPIIEEHIEVLCYCSVHKTSQHRTPELVIWCLHRRPCIQCRVCLESWVSTGLFKHLHISFILKWLEWEAHNVYISNLSLFLPQTEEDYIPYPSVHEVANLFGFFYVNMSVFSCKILVVKVCLFLWAGRYWVVQALYHSFCCPSLGVTGLKGPIMI